MRNRSLLFVFTVSCLLFGFFACKKATTDHNAVKESVLANNVFDLITATPELSSFRGLLMLSGYDRVLSSSKNFTVFAPTNKELENLDTAIIKNPLKLTLFVGNHISQQLYYSNSLSTPGRIQMMNGKYNNVASGKIEDAAITKADLYASNGVLHIVDRKVTALDNCWEYISNSINAPVKQRAYMLSLFQKVFDTSHAVIVGIDPNTGDPIYQAGTDSVFTNLFWNKVHDLRDEKKQYTIFLLQDAAWDAEVNKYKPFFATSNTDSTTKAASWAVVKDLSIEGSFPLTSIQDTVLSKFGTKVPVEKLSIVNTIKTSNGIVYIMGKVDVQPKHKFLETLVQAENYTASSVDRRGNTYFRDRFNTATSKDFRDVLVLGHGVALFNLRYQLPEMPTLKYKAYWVALNDFQTATFTQKLGIGAAASTTFGYTTVALNNYNEVYIGEFTLTQYQPQFNIYLTAANSTTAAVNPLVCDYIRLVPVL
ncbi:MAG: fasciclin domain-containing protein [Sphingobacteriales bacterium]|nr:MAG: fasciclin domain-containing protein [Sphingobacteriales bacterium]